MGLHAEGLPFRRPPPERGPATAGGAGGSPLGTTRIHVFMGRDYPVVTVEPSAKTLPLHTFPLPGA